MSRLFDPIEQNGSRSCKLRPVDNVGLKDEILKGTPGDIVRSYYPPRARLMRKL